MNCINCFAELSENDKFCGNCGNKILSSRITLKSIFHEFMDKFFSLDSKFFITVKDLLIKPEQVIKSYLQNNRTKYLTPMSFLIIGGLLGSFFSYLTINDYLGAIDYSSFDVSSEAQKNNPMYENFPHTMRRAFELSQKYYSLILFTSIPIIALISKIVFYNNKQYNFAEHIILYSYSYAQYLILSYVFIPFFLFNKNIINQFSFLTIFFIVAYHFYVLKRFFDLGWMSMLKKTLLFILVGLAFYFVISIIIGIVFIIYLIKTGQFPVN